MFQDVKGAKGQKLIVRKNDGPKKVEVTQSREKRYGKRFLTIRGKSIIADYQTDDTAIMYVIEEGTKTLLPVVKGVPREKARETANSIAKLMEAYESLNEKGSVTLELVVK